MSFISFCKPYPTPAGFYCDGESVPQVVAGPRVELGTGLPVIDVLLGELSHTAFEALGCFTCFEFPVLFNRITPFPLEFRSWTSTFLNIFFTTVSQCFRFPASSFGFVPQPLRPLLSSSPS